MPRRRRLSILLAGVVLLIPVLAAPASAAEDVERAEHARIVEHAEHARIVEHWTPERMRAAVPRDMALEMARGGIQAAKRPSGGSGASVVGASWTATNTTIYRASGKVYFEFGTSGYICSGAVVQDTRATHSLVLTAAHCAFNESTGQFATNWLFIPEFDSNPTYSCAATTYGCWTAHALVVHRGYATAGGFNTQATVHDYAVAVVGPGGKSGGQLDSTVGSFGIRFSAVADGTETYAFGYPAEGRYGGSDLVYSAGPVGSDPYTSNQTYRLKSDLNGGSSGGPWLTAFNTSTGVGTLTSVNSYTYRGVTNAMHGPKFDVRTQAVYDTANTTTSNAIVQ